MDSFTLSGYAGHATVGNTSYCFVADGHNDCIHHIRSLDMNQFATLPCPPTAIEASFAGKNLSGDTFVLARITHTTLEVFHVGDAKARVYVNDVLVHETLDTFLPEEIARTVNDTQEWMDSPGHYILDFQPYDTVRVVCWRGFLDTFDGNAKELCQHALKHWKQDAPDISVSLLLHSPCICIPYSLTSFTTDHVRNSFPFPIDKLDEVVRHDRKIFFLHFHQISSDLRMLLQNIHLKKVKLYYHDHWFWHLTLRSSCLEHDYLVSDILLDDYISCYSIFKIKRFITEILSC